MRHLCASWISLHSLLSSNAERTPFVAGRQSTDTSILSARDTSKPGLFIVGSRSIKVTESDQAPARTPLSNSKSMGNAARAARMSVEGSSQPTGARVDGSGWLGASVGAQPLRGSMDSSVLMSAMQTHKLPSLGRSNQAASAAAAAAAGAAEAPVGAAAVVAVGSSVGPAAAAAVAAPGVLKPSPPPAGKPTGAVRGGPAARGASRAGRGTAGVVGGARGGRR